MCKCLHENCGHAMSKRAAKLTMKCVNLCEKEKVAKVIKGKANQAKTNDCREKIQ